MTVKAVVPRLIALFSLVWVAHQLHVSADGSLKQSDEPPSVYLPDAGVLGTLSLGQQTTMADAYFLKLVQYVGTPVAEQADWPALGPLADVVTDLDPRYGYAYEVAGVLLASKRRIAESNRILEKGMAAIPSRWQLPFFAAFNYWYDLGDMSTGGKLLMQAAAIPGRPEYVSELAARLFASEGDIDTALSMLDGLISQPLPDGFKSNLVSRQRELQIERDLQQIESALDAYEREEGSPAPSLEALVGRYLDRVPRPPGDSGRYEYDPLAHKVSTPLLPKRLKLATPNELVITATGTTK